MGKSSTGESGIAEEFITLARVLKTQGRLGEVAVEVHSDIPDRFRKGMRLWAQFADGSRRKLQVEELWPHKGQLVLKFVGVGSISAAEAILRCELQVPREQRGQLERGWTYVSDLVGCVVFDREREIGKIEGVQFGTGEAPLLIVKGKSQEYEIPYAEAYLQGVDTEHKQIRMQLPKGILDLNAPLTLEEKQQQGSSKRKK